MGAATCCAAALVAFQMSFLECECLFLSVALDTLVDELAEGTLEHLDDAVGLELIHAHLRRRHIERGLGFLLQ